MLRTARNDSWNELLFGVFDMSMTPKRASRQQPIQIGLPGSGQAEPAISIVIPTKNEEKLLERCLSQFTTEIRQRFALELIVSDGGSTDDTIGIATAYADSIATHEGAWRQTIAEGRNRGASLARADLLLFLNADTLLADAAQFLERAQQRFAVDEGLAAIATRVEVFPEERRLSDRLFHAYFNRYVKICNAFGLGMGRGECQIVRRKAFEALRGYNPGMAAGEDFDLYRRLRSIGSIRFDHALLVYESPRRYRKYGYRHVYFDWIKNGFAVLLKNRSSDQVWEEVR
ncbi:MAG: glycosyltransferase [Bacteroidota bacterium]|nr:glycosyltransferase [Bacteroidota bacterium]MDP4241851.1 glycosyltransferase [Bacteroidota bacterium]MDP4288400.1 glycosyltransferase [Bacteroidota bacterium]